MEHSSAQSNSAQETDTIPPTDAVQQSHAAPPTDSLVPVSQLVEQGPVRLKQYLAECEQGTREPANLDLILEVAEYRASDEASLDWAEIAIRAANLGAANDPTRRHSYLYRAMLVRTLFITRLGSRPGHLVLDPAAIIDWFHAELKFSPTEARQLSERWKDHHFQHDFASELDAHNAGPKTSSDDPSREPPHISETLNELLELQLLKYRLQLLRRLAESGELPATPANTEWLQTAKHLP